MFSAKRCIRAFSSMKDLILKKEWYKAYTQLEKERKIEDPELITSLAWGLNNIGRYDEAYKLIQMMPSLGKEPSELEYTAALESSIRQKNIEMATNLFYQAKVYGISFDAALYNLFIDNLCKHLGIWNLKSIVEHMKKDGCTPSIYTCLNLMKIGYGENDRDFVNQIAIVAKQADYSIPKKIIDKYTKPKLQIKETPKKTQLKENLKGLDGNELTIKDIIERERIEKKYDLTMLKDKGIMLDEDFDARTCEPTTLREMASLDAEDSDEEELEGEESSSEEDMEGEFEDEEDFEGEEEDTEYETDEGPGSSDSE